MKKLILLLLSVVQLLPAQKNKFVGGWIPYWKPKESIEEVLAHIDQIDEISPFSYELDAKCNLYNPFARNRADWDSFFEICRAKKIKIVPTIFWTSTRGIDSVLSSTQKTDRHIAHIVSLVQKEKMDGININYEKISSLNRIHFLEFVQKLSKRMHELNLLFYCTLGARTGDRTIGVLYNNHKKECKPGRIQDKFKNCSVSLSPGIGEEGAQFKKALVDCCDRIYIMCYDEWGKPFFYRKEALKSNYFISHASHQWIDQALAYALTYIPKEKLVIGLPSYALEFQIIRENDLLKFKKTRNLTMRDAAALAKKHNITPTHTLGLEKCFTYTHHHNHERYVCFVDSDAIADRISLAQKYGVNGLYFFKIDGGHEPVVWDIVKRGFGE